MNIRNWVRAALAGAAAFHPGKSVQAELRTRKFRWAAPLSFERRVPFGGNILLRGLDDLRSIDVRSAEGPERVSHERQRVEGVEILGTWFQNVEDAAGRPVFQAGRWIESLPPGLGPRVREVSGNARHLTETMRGNWALARGGKTIGAPKLRIVPEDDGGFRLEWTWVAMNDQETEIVEARFDERGSFLATRDAGFHAIDAVATVFPRGPRASALDQVTLDGLDGSGGLRSALLTTSSGQSLQARASNNRFEFPVDDPRFDQVQAYYYADSILQWFYERFAYAAPSHLDLKVQVGENSNAAYYYDNKVRIGSGDGVRFTHMPRDPSIVMHEVLHSIVDHYAHLPADGEGGGLNEALADFFSLSFLETPRSGEVANIAEPYTRTLENTASYEESIGAGPYGGARFVGGTLWDLREALGRDKAEKLAFRTMLRLGSGSVYSDFVPSLRAAADGLCDEAERSLIREILASRGWPLNDWAP